MYGLKRAFWLNKLAEQIAETLKEGKLYRNIPFDKVFLDVLVEDDIALVAVKSLEDGLLCLKVREYKVPVQSFAPFLAMNGGQRKNDGYESSAVASSDTRLLKQISQGVAEIVMDSKRKNEKWVFPFFNSILKFKKTERKNTNLSGEKSDTVEGKVSFELFSGGMSAYRTSGIVSGTLFEHTNPVVRLAVSPIMLDYQIYEVLENSHSNFSYYHQMSELPISSFVLGE